jgi:hypothetical protein
MSRGSTGEKGMKGEDGGRRRSREDERGQPGNAAPMPVAADDAKKGPAAEGKGDRQGDLRCQGGHRRPSFATSIQGDC